MMSLLFMENPGDGTRAHGRSPAAVAMCNMRRAPYECAGPIELPVEADNEEFHNHALEVLHRSMSKTTSGLERIPLWDFYVGPAYAANINTIQVLRPIDLSSH
jgi:hypothetical protein